MIFLFPIMMGLLLLGFPIFISLGVASMTIFTMAFSHIPLVVVIQRMFAGMDNFAIMSMPFFILAANVAARGELSKRILNLGVCRSTHGLLEYLCYTAFHENTNTFSAIQS